MKRHRRLWVRAVFACFWILAIPPAAAQQSSELQDLFQQWDSDGRSGSYPSPEDIFIQLDADGNEEVTSEEVPEDAQWFLEFFDRDKGGSVNWDEIILEVKDAITRQANRDDTINRETGPRANFERSAPPVGAVLPDVTGYKADGEEIRLRSLQGNYAVLVFGCLT